MSDLAYRAMMFAREVHGTHVRKYTGNPYTDHLAEVAGIVATVVSDIAPHEPGVPVATAWLHDCIEDCGVSVDTITERFGFYVSCGVLMLSDTETGNRDTRKALSRERLSKAPRWVQTIKCADLISNTSSILKHDPKFAVTYLAEKRALLDVLTAAHPLLLELARSQAA